MVYINTLTLFMYYINTLFMYFTLFFKVFRIKTGLLIV